MIARIYDNQWITLENITPYEESILWREFSIAKKGMEFIDVTEAGRWDGVYRFYNKFKRRLARPFLAKLKQVCNDNNLALTVCDHRPEQDFKPIDPESIGSDFLGPTIKLEEYQTRAIQTACKMECGIIAYPTGSGKTEIIAGICKAIPCATVILATQTVVVDQIKARLELRKVVEEVGLFYAGNKPNGELIIVGAIQSLLLPTRMPQAPTRTEKDTDSTFRQKLKSYDLRLQAFKTRRNNAKWLRSVCRKAGMVIVDECDLASSNYFKDFFRNVFRGRRRYGMSGTPFDPDKPIEAMRVREHLGSIIATESTDTVQALGRIIPVEMFMLAIEGNKDDASAYDIAYNDHIVNSEKFWKMVLAICKKYPNEGTLILVDRKDLGLNLQRVIMDSGIHCEFIHGETPKRRRTEMLRKFENREFKVLIGGKIINRGLDLKNGCENLIIATGGKLWSEFKQKVGRAVRINQTGKGRVFDFYFRCNTYLYQHSRARLKAMVGMGYRTTVIFPKIGSVDGEQFIASRFRITKGILRNSPKA